MALSDELPVAQIEYSHLLCDQVYCLSNDHEDECKRLHMTGHEMPPFEPPSYIINRAEAIGATFLMDQRVPDEVMDPAAHVARLETKRLRARESQVRPQ